MAHKKSAAETPTQTDDDRLDQSTVNNLAQEIRILREAVDELRELLEWAIQNREAPANDHPFLPDR